MKANISLPSEVHEANLRLTGSKSESNRLLILQALYPRISIANLSESDDTKVLQQALSSTEERIDIHHAGTAMRFLTAYLAFQEGKTVILTGSPRMQQRPIKILVDALKHVGAEIQYLKKEGYPPLKITGTRPKGNEVRLAANVSSQYISALLLIAPSLPDGLKLHLEGTITSAPYVQMTLMLLKKLGVSYRASGATIDIQALSSCDTVNFVVESDWSSASYLYSWVALSNNSSITVSSLFKESLQGDSALAMLYAELGVRTIFDSEKHSITLTKEEGKLPTLFQKDLSETPDIAQTLVVTCFGLGIAAHFTGLHTLKIKETDRLLAIKAELEKMGAQISVTDHSLTLEAKTKEITIPSEVLIKTYEDHRMAMAFAPMVRFGSFSIENPDVVNKSYPTFWEDMKQLGMNVEIDA